MPTKAVAKSRGAATHGERATLPSVVGPPPQMPGAPRGSRWPHTVGKAWDVRTESRAGRGPGAPAPRSNEEPTLLLGRGVRRPCCSHIERPLKTRLHGRKRLARGPRGSASTHRRRVFKTQEGTPCEPTLLQAGSRGAPRAWACVRGPEGRSSAGPGSPELGGPQRSAHRAQRSRVRPRQPRGIGSTGMRKASYNCGAFQTPGDETQQALDAEPQFRVPDTGRQKGRRPHGQLTGGDSNRKQRRLTDTRTDFGAGSQQAAK